MRSVESRPKKASASGFSAFSWSSVLFLKISSSDGGAGVAGAGAGGGGGGVAGLVGGGGAVTGAGAGGCGFGLRLQAAPLTAAIRITAAHN